MRRTPSRSCRASMQPCRNSPWKRRSAFRRHLEAVRDAPLSPVLGGVGSGVRGGNCRKSGPLTPAPLPRVRGRGAARTWDHGQEPTMDFRLPELGEGVYEAEFVAWRVKPGDPVKRGQILLEVLTDKATMEVPSPFAGTITELRA